MIKHKLKCICNICKWLRILKNCLCAMCKVRWCSRLAFFVNTFPNILTLWHWHCDINIVTLTLSVVWSKVLSTVDPKFCSQWIWSFIHSGSEVLFTVDPKFYPQELTHIPDSIINISDSIIILRTLLRIFRTLYMIFRRLCVIFRTLLEISDVLTWPHQRWARWKYCHMWSQLYYL